jgi:uncharacterized protein (TIGR02996 family)
MSPDEFALLQAVRATPADDTPRLVYADWLEERGDEASVARAEYIRLECAADRLKKGTPEWQELDKNASELAEVFADRWRKELEEGIQSRYPTIRFGRPPDGDVFDMLYDRGFITTLAMSWGGLRAFPDLAPLVGPIEFLSLHLADGEGFSDDVSENWNVRRLKVLELRSESFSFGEMLLRFHVLNVRARGGLSSVPILRLVTSLTHLEVTMADVVGSIMGSEVNPVVIHAMPMSHSVVVDPLNLWPLVGPWAERFATSRWHFADHVLSAAQQQRIPSARYPHLVRYYQLAGLPPPSPTGERVPKGVPPKRGILSRAARWFRRRG